MASVAVHSAIAVFLLTLIHIQMGVAQSPSPECIPNLLPCANYLNSTHPPKTCCDPLRQAVTHQLPCLCKLYNDKKLMETLHINVTQALKLPSYCGIPGNTSECDALAPSSSSPTKPNPPPPASVPPSGNSVRSFACTGLSILLVLGASWMLW